MALTPEQKELNKKATSLRNKAYSERYRAYRDGLDEAERTAQASDAHQAWKAAAVQIDKALNTRNEAVDAIRARIRLLEQEIDQVNKASSDEIEAIRKVRDQKGKEYFAAKDALEQDVKSRFPDMDGCHGAAGWKPIDEFIEQARQDEAPAATLKRMRP